MQRFGRTTEHRAAGRELNCFPSPRRGMSGPIGIEPGDAAPQFELPNANPAIGGDSMSLSDVMGENGAIIAFTCNHCPYVVGSESRIEYISAKPFKVQVDVTPYDLPRELKEKLQKVEK